MRCSTGLGRYPAPLRRPTTTPGCATCDCAATAASTLEGGRVLGFEPVGGLGPSTAGVELLDGSREASLAPLAVATRAACRLKLSASCRLNAYGHSLGCIRPQPGMHTATAHTARGALPPGVEVLAVVEELARHCL